MITFTCKCGRKLHALDDYAGNAVQCRSCGEHVAVPGAEQIQRGLLAKIEIHLHAIKWWTILVFLLLLVLAIRSCQPVPVRVEGLGSNATCGERLARTC